jgi:heptaprenyl diphosphate synthase
MDAVRIASAIEIVHLASLVHDDVMDDADIRRGKETLQRKCGKKTAVICGDYLLSLALKKAAQVSIKKELLERDLKLQDYIGRLCLGELYQHINNGNTRLTPYQYLKIISGKTAALFEASFLAGGIISGVDGKESKNYRRLGYYIGMIFQLTDDCNDFEISEEMATKPVQSDYEQGVITLPLIHAFEAMPDFREKAATGKASRTEINKAVEKAGGLSFTRGIIKAFYNKAMKTIDIIDASEDKKKRLVSILDKASRMI